MRAEITDREAIGALTPGAVAAYLRARGWTAGGSDAAVAAFERPPGEASGEPLVVELPLQAAMGDYARRMAELLHNLALIEGRSQLEIYRDVFRANQDVVRLSIDVPESGRVGLEEASALFAATRDLVLAAACSAHTRRAYFPNRKPQAAVEYVRRVRIAAPEAGSFVVVLESPVPPALSPEPAAAEPPAEPFERAAIAMLAAAGAHVRRTIDDATATGSLDRFGEAVAAGVNANYCDALARLLDEDHGRNVTMSFAWAASRPPQRPLPSRIAFSRGESQVLRLAAQYLKERAPIAGFELAGPIVKLVSGSPAAGGEVAIAGLVDGDIRQVLVRLGGDDYRQAVLAHQQEQPVSVEGELVRDGRSYRLSQPRLFAIIA